MLFEHVDESEQEQLAQLQHSKSDMTRLVILLRFWLLDTLENVLLVQLCDCTSGRQPFFAHPPETSDFSVGVSSNIFDQFTIARKLQLFSS